MNVIHLLKIRETLDAAILNRYSRSLTSNPNRRRDCTEIFVQTPSSLENQSQTYSNYKSHSTFKALVGISTTGAVVFISKLWGGSASDVEITRQF
jgi:hypothetical protein